MSDWISRGALIEEMCNNCSTEACEGMGKASTAKCYAMQIIENQPKVGEWIPCSERLPEKSGRYLVWMGSTEQILVEPYSTRINEFGVYDFAGHSMDEEIIKPKAWMPLPEPYQPEEKR